MIYDGKRASIEIQNALREQVAKLSSPPSLAVISASSHPSIASFIKIKRKFGEAIGVTVNEFNFPESIGGEQLILEIQKILQEKEYTGAVVQLPLPSSYNVEKILSALPQSLDVDILGKNAWEDFVKHGTNVPPVAGAVAHILNDTKTEIHGKNIVIIGQGRLVGLPVTTWLKHQGVTPHIVDITTSDEVRMKLYKEADIVVTGIGSPHHLRPEYFKNNVILIDAGTSEQSGVLAGDCNPDCATTALVFTPVPGGVGPLTVAHLFKNIVGAACSL